MGLLGPKEGAQGGAQGSPPKGLYKQRKGVPKTLILALLLFTGTIHVNSTDVNSSRPLLRAQALGRLRGSSNPDRYASSRTCGYLGGAASAAQGRAAREEVLATALPASIYSTTSTRDRSSASARLLVIP